MLNALPTLNAVVANLIVTPTKANVLNVLATAIVVRAKVVIPPLGNVLNRALTAVTVIQILADPIVNPILECALNASATAIASVIRRLAIPQLLLASSAPAMLSVVVGSPIASSIKGVVLNA